MDEKRFDTLLKSLAVEMSNTSIALTAIRQLLDKKHPGFTADFDRLFEQLWDEHAPPTIKYNYQCLLHPERSLSKSNMRWATDQDNATQS